MSKRCPRCEIEKEDTEFYKNKRTKSGLSCYCKVCRALEDKKYGKENRGKLAERLRNWRAKNPEKEKEYYKKYSVTHREKIISRRKRPEQREKQRILVKNWYHNNKERAQKNNREYKRKNRVKENARSLIAKAIRRNKMTRPNKCEICFKKCKPEAHHTDYSNPLDVQWLCRICHKHQHGKLLDISPLV